MIVTRLSWFVTLCYVVSLSTAATPVCPAERLVARDDQGQQIRLSSDQLMARIVRKTSLTFPMLDGGHLHGTVEFDVVIDRTGKVACARLVTGHPIAAARGLEAILAWRFQPFVFRRRRVAVAGHLSIPYDVEGFGARKSN